MILRQYTLRSDKIVIVCWLEDGRVKVGDVITLKDIKDEEMEWTVQASYSAVDEKHLNRGWDNNI